MKDELKLVVTFFSVFCSIVFLSSCARNENVCKGIVQGIYKGANQVQEMKKDDPNPEPGKELPSYDQYERERQKMKKETD
jgi:hypothetical protein